MKVDIKDKLYKSISDYCKANRFIIKDYINDLLNTSFMRDKYGDRPFSKAVQYEPPLPSNTPAEVEIKVIKNKETKEYVVDMKETTIPIENDNKPIEIFPQLEDVVIDFSKQEELKPEIPMTPDDDYKKEKPKRRKLK